MYHVMIIGLVKYVRFAAYMSDIGESFRPIAKPAVVKATYGISIAYVTGDILYAGYQESQVRPCTLRVSPAVCAAVDN